MLRHAIQAKVLQIFYGIASENYWIWDGIVIYSQPYPIACGHDECRCSELYCKISSSVFLCEVAVVSAVVSAEFTGDRWILHTNGKLRGKCSHLMTPSWCIFKSHFTGTGAIRLFKCQQSDRETPGWIKLINKSQNAAVPYPTVLHSEQKCVHFCSEWSIWDMEQMHSGICEIGPFLYYCPSVIAVDVREFPKMLDIMVLIASMRSVYGVFHWRIRMYRCYVLPTTPGPWKQQIHATIHLVLLSTT